MHREITLAQDTRCLRRVGQSDVLTDEGDARRKGDILTISPPGRLWFDHKYREAVSFILNQQFYYMLVSELNVPEVASE